MKLRPDPLHYWKGKRILKYVPVVVQLCNYRLLHEPLEFYMSGGEEWQRSIHLKQRGSVGEEIVRCENWRELYSIVGCLDGQDSSTPGKCIANVAFTINFQTLKCLINLVFGFKCFLLIRIRWVIKRVGKTQLKYERKNICFRDLYFALNWGFVDSYQLSYKYLVPRENQTLQSPVNNNKIYQPQGGDLKYNYSMPWPGLSWWFNAR